MVWGTLGGARSEVSAITLLSRVWVLMGRGEWDAWGRFPPMEGGSGVWGCQWGCLSSEPLQGAPGTGLADMRD